MTEETEELPQLPKGWVWTRLGDIRLDNSSAVVPAKTPTQMFELYSVPKFEEGKPEIVSGKEVGSNKQIVEEETVLLCKINPRINRVWIVGNFSSYPKIASTEWISFFKQEGIDPKYLCYFMHNNDFKIHLASNVSGVGGSLMRIRPATFSQYPFPLAPFPEQRRIVSKIEELFSFLDAGVESLRKVKALLKRYRQAVLKYAFEGKLTEEWRKTHKDQTEPAQKLLEQIKQQRQRRGEYEELPPIDTSNLPELPETWSWTTIGELETFIGSGITPKGGKRVYVGEGIPFIRSQNVHPDGLRLEEVAHVTSQMHEEMARTHTYPNDVLLNITGASIGRSTYVPEELAEANVNQHVCIIRTGWWLVPAFLSHFLNSTHGQAQIFSTQSGVTRQGLNYRQVRNLRIPLAPLTEQKEVVDRVQETYSTAYEVENIVKQGIKRSERLRQSILKRAFAGRLVPQDPNDEPAEKLLERTKGSKMMQDTKSKNSTRDVGLMHYVE